MNNTISKLVLGATLLFSSVANAGVIDYNDVIPNTFYDTSTDLIWLDTKMTGWSSYSSWRYSSYSYGPSITIDQNLLNFSDFRIATEGEVRGLISSAFTNVTFDQNGNYSYSDYWSRSSGGDRSIQDPLFYDDWLNFISVVGGYTYSTSNSYSDGDRNSRTRIDGLYKTDDGNYGYLKAETYTSTNYSRSWTGSRRLSSETDSSNISFQPLFNVDPSSNTNRLWMVYSPTSVSVTEPSTLIIFTLALMGLTFRKFKLC